MANTHIECVCGYNDYIMVMVVVEKAGDSEFSISQNGQAQTIRPMIVIFYLLVVHVERC